jgi:hypothetical protein
MGNCNCLMPKDNGRKEVDVEKLENGSNNEYPKCDDISSEDKKSSRGLNPSQNMTKKAIKM